MVAWGMNRRHFLKHMTAASMTLPMLQWMESARAAQSKSKKAKNRSMILLWMGGGPSTIDIWDLKPESKNGGEFKPIPTTGAGQICEHLPNLAKQMKHLSIVRSYNSRDGAHDRGTYVNHTSYLPVASVVHPAVGAVVAKFNGVDSEIPGHISLGGPGVSPGFLGTAYAPFRVTAGDNPIPNLKSSAGWGHEGEARLARRRDLLEKTQSAFLKQNRGSLPADHHTIYSSAMKLMSSQLLDAFKIEKEETSVREKYGDTQFGRDCLLARRLVEINVPFIEVGFGGWDMHQSIFNNLAGTGRTTAMANATPHLPTMDKGFAALVEDLVERGLWDTTTICWMGDFGRTPKINQDGGRDHWPGVWSVVLGGGGMKGGEVIGKTDEDGLSITDRPVEVSNLFATLYKSVGIEPATELRSANGRPLKLVGTFGDGQPISELF